MPELIIHLALLSGSLHLFCFGDERLRRGVEQIRKVSCRNAAGRRWEAGVPLQLVPAERQTRSRGWGVGGRSTGVRPAPGAEQPAQLEVVDRRLSLTVLNRHGASSASIPASRTVPQPRSWDPHQLPLSSFPCSPGGNRTTGNHGQRIKTGVII